VKDRADNLALALKAKDTAAKAGVGGGR